MPNIHSISNLTINSHYLHNKLSMIISSSIHPFKTGNISINGYNIVIKHSDPIHLIAYKINEVKTKTRVEASVVIRNDGKQRLILKTNNSEINITDDNRILIGLLGISENFLIQVVHINPNKSVKINYYYRDLMKSQANISSIHLINGEDKQQLATVPKETWSMPTVALRSDEFFRKNLNEAFEKNKNQ